MKALILYTNTGAGHHSASKAICEALKSIDVKTIEIDTLSFAGKTTSKKIENSYVNIVRKAPNFFGLLYKAGTKISNPKIKSIIYILNTLYANKIYTLIKNEKPDLIICTHIFCAQTISYLYRKYSFNSLTATIVTDYTCAPFWEETNLDYYFIPHKDLTDEFIGKGINANKILPFGLPINTKFNYHNNKVDSKKELNLNPNLNHILIMGGSMGAGDIFNTTLSLSKELNNTQFSVICGNNIELFNRFKNRSLSTNINVLSFATNIDKLMDSSDILITKPGGLTTTEAMTKNLPVILINPIPGVESKNCNFFINHNMAIASNSIAETLKACKLLLNDNTVSKSIISSQIENINPNAAIDIANFLVNNLKNRRNQ